MAMLVGDGPGRTLRLILQPDHAQLAGQFAAHWRRPGAVPAAMWPRVIEAVAQHDLGWREAERVPALDARGRPHSFKSLPTSAHVAIWRAGVSRTLATDRYMGLLVALHARWLYTTFMKPGGRTEACEAQAFVAEMDQRIDAAIDALAAGDRAQRAAVQPAALMTARRLVAGLDGLSLMLCGALPFGATAEPVAFGERAARVTPRASPAGARLWPWPFDSDTVAATVTARDVADRAYADADDLRRALEAAEPRTLHFLVTPGE